MASGQAKKPFAFGYAAIPMMLVLPPLVYWMWWCMIRHQGAMVPPDMEFVRSIPLPTWKAAGIFGGWLAFQMLLQQYAPGPWIEGTPLRDGTRLKYRMNGWFSWWVTWAVLAGLVLAGWVKPTVLYDEFGPLMSTVNVFTILFCIYLYVWGVTHQDDGRRVWTGNAFYDYFMGTALNPRNGSFDWKLFCEARPGLIGWVAINLSIAAKQYETYNTVSTPMILVCFFHFWYVADYYFHEEAILTTWDIKHENFGWMLCWGDLVWVPFTYTLQALYIATRAPYELPIVAYVGIVALNFAGFAIFRGTNIQKHFFRKDPNAPLKWWGVKPQYIQTAHGSRLLTNGFWGWARHLNYCGELMMGLACCLECGFIHVPRHLLRKHRCTRSRSPLRPCIASREAPRPPTSSRTCTASSRCPSLRGEASGTRSSRRSPSPFRGAQSAS
jgi:Delta14-sterol reductase